MRDLGCGAGHYASQFSILETALDAVRAGLDLLCRASVEEGFAPLCSVAAALGGVFQGHFDSKSLIASLVAEGIGVIAGLGCEVVTGAETSFASTVACVAAGALVAAAITPAVKRALK